MIPGLLGVSRPTTLSRDLRRLTTERATPRHTKQPTGSDNIASTVSYPLGVPKCKTEPESKPGTSCNWRLGVARQSAVRTDGLELKKWINVSTTSGPLENAEAIPTIEQSSGLAGRSHIEKYSFMNFDRETYDRVLQTLDHKWQFEETKYLIGLVLKFELNFHVVTDRYAFGSSPETVGEDIEERPIEDIKYRFYSVAKALVEFEQERLRNELVASGKKGLSEQTMKENLQRNPFVKYVYDPAAEREKKAILEKQFIWDPEQQCAEAEIQAVVSSIQRIIEAGQKNYKSSQVTQKGSPPSASGELPGLAALSGMPCQEANEASSVLEEFQSALIPMTDLSCYTSTAGSSGPTVTTASKMLTTGSSGFTKALVGLQSSSGKQSSTEQTQHESLISEMDSKIDRCIWNSIKHISGTPHTGLSAFDMGIENESAAYENGGDAAVSSSGNLMTGSALKKRKVIKQQASKGDWVGNVYWELEEQDPKVYFEKTINSVKPPVVSMRTIQAFMLMKLDAAVVRKMRVHRDKLCSIKEEWIQKVQTLRRAIQIAHKRLPSSNRPATTTNQQPVNC